MREEGGGWEGFLERGRGGGGVGFFFLEGGRVVFFGRVLFFLGGFGRFGSFGGFVVFFFCGERIFFWFFFWGFWGFGRFFFLGGGGVRVFRGVLEFLGFYGFLGSIGGFRFLGFFGGREGVLRVFRVWVLGFWVLGIG